MAALYVVATPIGNLEDLTARALRVLSEVSVIYAEDTRVTGKLLRHFEIETPLFSLHQHSSARAFDAVRTNLADGKDVAYVTDAGTPGISDPGGALVAFVAKGLPQTQIIPVPGPSSLAAALSVAGIPLDEFWFVGFLPHKKGRQTQLRKISESRMPVILFESVHRIRKLLTELAPLGVRVIVCRELTKKFETVYRGTPDEVLNRLSTQETKGEFVVIVHRYEN
jgi:16S rRNA (cytidine1402-2'-O)-methyltransferase